MPALDQDQSADICIIGAGIAGLSTAYLLVREGRNVIVIDAGQPGGGETCRTSAHLCSAIDDGFLEIERLHGKDGAHLAYTSHAAAINIIEQIIKDEGIDCDFKRVDGYLIRGSGMDPKDLDRELEAAHRSGFIEAEQVAQPAVPTLEGGRCNRYPNQAQFHPQRYMAGLCEAIVRGGGRIFSEAHVTEINPGEDSGFNVATQAGWEIHANLVVAATNSPITSIVTIHTKQAAYRSYVVALRIPRGSVPLALYWDTEDPYHYVRVHQLWDDSGDDLLIVGGEDHKVGQDTDSKIDPEIHFKHLREWAKTYFPMVGEVEYHWSGQVMETIDGLAFIGRNPMGPDGLYLATGDSGMGLTHGTIAGMLLRDQISDRVNPWTKIYDPARLRVGALATWAKENLNVALQYKDYAVTPGEESTAEEIEPGHGAVIIEDGQRVAAFRDGAGQLHRCSAVCTHLGGIVHWNPVEMSWDCPCHGSRFTPDGTLLHGPAIQPLSRIY